MKEFKRTNFIRDAVHKNIDISEPVIRELIACAEFQRLRWISQLGGAQIAFPSATHNRYTHSLGVYHILNRVCQEAKNNHLISDESKLLVKIAGLLHDLGHGPFSHTFEKIVNFDHHHSKSYNHEWYTTAIINDPLTEINQVLTRHHINIEQVIAIINKDEQKCHRFQIQLVSSQIDCDRMDYLIRDGYFCGVNYGAIDLDWVMANMIFDQKHGIVFDVKALSAIENYLITRYHMYWQVYYHKSSLRFDLLLQQLFAHMAKLEKHNYQWKITVTKFFKILLHQPFSISEYLQLWDNDVISLLKQIITNEKDEKLVDLAKEILLLKHDQQIIIQPILSKNDVPKSTIRLLKNIIYNPEKQPIMIKLANNEIVNLIAISYIFQKPTNMQTFSYSLISNKDSEK